MGSNYRAGAIVWPRLDKHPKKVIREIQWSKLPHILPDGRRHKTAIPCAIGMMVSRDGVIVILIGSGDDPSSHHSCLNRLSNSIHIATADVGSSQIKVEKSCCAALGQA
jgi:hypothetical protein